MSQYHAIFSVSKGETGFWEVYLLDDERIASFHNVEDAWAYVDTLSERLLKLMRESEQPGETFTVSGVPPWDGVLWDG